MTQMHYKDTEIRQRLSEGYTQRAIVDELNVSFRDVAKISKAMKEENVKTEHKNADLQYIEKLLDENAKQRVEIQKLKQQIEDMRYHSNKLASVMIERGVQLATLPATNVTATLPATTTATKRIYKSHRQRYTIGGQ